MVSKSIFKYLKYTFYVFLLWFVKIICIFGYLYKNLGEINSD